MGSGDKRTSQTRELSRVLGESRGFLQQKGQLLCYLIYLHTMEKKGNITIVLYVARQTMLVK